MFMFGSSTHLNSIETYFLNPIEKHLFRGTSGPSLYRARSSMFTVFYRLMALNSVELTPCFWTLFLYPSHFYRINKFDFLSGGGPSYFSTIKSLSPTYPLTYCNSMGIIMLYHGARWEEKP